MKVTKYRIVECDLNGINFEVKCIYESWEELSKNLKKYVTGKTKIFKIQALLNIEEDYKFLFLFKKKFNIKIWVDLK